MKKFLIGLTLVLFLAPVAYAVCLTNPQLLLKESYKYKNFTVHSDKAIPVEIENVLDKALANLSRSELYTPDFQFRVNICHSNNLFTFFTRNKNAGGVVNGILSDHAFIRECDIINNEIIPPGGWLLSRHDRPLSYFIAHELTHSLQSKYDRFMILKTEHYIIEGYADYIAKSDSYNFEHYKNLLINNDKLMNPANGLYNRYHLYIAYLMDKKEMRFIDILKQSPDMEQTLHQISTN